MNFQINLSVSRCEIRLRDLYRDITFTGTILSPWEAARKLWRSVGGREGGTISKKYFLFSSLETSLTSSPALSRTVSRATTQSVCIKVSSPLSNYNYRHGRNITKLKLKLSYELYWWLPGIFCDSWILFPRSDNRRFLHWPERDEPGDDGSQPVLRAFLLQDGLHHPFLLRRYAGVQNPGQWGRPQNS